MGTLAAWLMHRLWHAGPAIYHFQQVEAEGAVFWLPLLLFIGVCESYRVGLGWAEPRSQNFYSLRDDYEPGNLGFDPLGLLPEDPKERKDMMVSIRRSPCLYNAA